MPSATPRRFDDTQLVVKYLPGKAGKGVVVIPNQVSVLCATIESCHQHFQPGDTLTIEFVEVLKDPHLGAGDGGTMSPLWT